jgi:transposase-like protein
VPDHFIEDLLAERGITVSREAIRLWCIKFGALYARRLKRKHRGFGDTFYIDEVFAGVPDHLDQWQTALLEWMNKIVSLRVISSIASLQ